ncbi:hypothetical protein SEA_REMUSLOOPIN_41 [Streptomyces phage RemusLoopin]|uniref:Uncharacterized protein n=1 Tax=Streptomyces phage RemusLoopin TaxID=2562346 RepID=A0A4D6E5H4_9CAUD|nr:hypothetical protein SEA_REMUSLOOPIN_41 [Streptomyces phage RemusLoopin]
MSVSPSSPWSPNNMKETAPMLSVTRETKAVLKTKTGERVVAFTKDSEPGIASLAIPGDRAKLSPREMRELAAWLNETAAEQEKVTRETAKTSLTFNGTRYERRTMSPQERAYQDLIARGLRP